MAPAPPGSTVQDISDGIHPAKKQRLLPSAEGAAISEAHPSVLAPGLMNPFDNLSAAALQQPVMHPQQLGALDHFTSGQPLGEVDPMAGGNDNLYFGSKSRWRKYGEKQPAGKEGVLKTYFRCTHPGCPAKRTVTRQPMQAMEDGIVEMVTGHNHTEAEYQIVLADGTPRQHQRFKGDSAHPEMVEEDLGGLDTAPTLVAAPSLPHKTAEPAVVQEAAGAARADPSQFNMITATPGSLADIVLVVKAFDHECHLFVGGREQIEKVARSAGARVMKNLSKSVTHVLAPKAQINDPVYQSAYAGMTMVDEEWLRNAVGSRTQAAQDPSGMGGLAAGGHMGAGPNESIVARCPICHKGFSTSQGMGGHYGRCKASFLAEQAGNTAPALGGHPVAPKSLNVGYYVCEHGWLAADCSECKIGQDDPGLHSISVPVSSLAPKPESNELANLFTDDFCMHLNNLLGVVRVD
eukprot:TRINITY_DN10001_c0_g1_i1.p1 TRINITY_DN10001_c0_g1~~TRINITY_DN10001_c0_g1_i1.p1  ORF type:complete len:464 (+),score=129.68 TRINITY_DN10001_c0_g1_i1:178-1569(+)